MSEAPETTTAQARPRSALRRTWQATILVRHLAERLVFGLLPLAFAGLAIFLVVREATREPLEIAEISVPSALADTGFTPQVAAQRLLDAVNATARAVRAETMHRPATELEAAEPDLNIPAAGISLRSLSNLVRGLLGWPERKLSGEILVNGETLRLRLRLAGHGVIADATATTAEGPDVLLGRAAPEVWRFIAPRLYAWHIAQSDAEEQDIRDRLAVLRRQVSDAETEATILFLTARSLVRSGRASEALELLEPLLAGQPRSAAPHYGRALALRALGDHEGALAAQREGLARDPASAWAHLASSEILRELGRLEEALEATRIAQRLDIDDPDGPVEEAHVLRRMGRLSEAAAAARRAVALDHAHAPAHAALGHVLVQQREEVAALAAFERALALAPHLADAHTGRGEALAAMGRAPDALESLARAIALDAVDHRPHGARGELLGRLEQWGEALEAYDAAIARAPEVAALHLGRGVALARLGRTQEAVGALRRAEALGLRDPALAALLAELSAR